MGRLHLLEVFAFGFRSFGTGWLRPGLGKEWAGLRGQRALIHIKLSSHKDYHELHIPTICLGFSLSLRLYVILLFLFAKTSLTSRATCKPRHIHTELTSSTTFNCVKTTTIFLPSFRYSALSFPTDVTQVTRQAIPVSELNLHSAPTWRCLLRARLSFLLFSGGNTQHFEAGAELTFFLCLSSHVVNRLLGRKRKGEEKEEEEERE